jgi:MFS transporter, UMF1 family
LLARLAPPDQVGQFYGLFALSGKLTAFAGPIAVAAVTTITQSQRAGFSVLIVFLGVGATLLAMVATSGGSGARR